MSPGQSPERERLAAEFAVGLLEGDDRREAERLFEIDSAFRTDVAQWQARLGEVDDTAPEATASESLWARIESGLVRDTVSDPVTARRPAAVPNPLAAFAALWRSLAFWRGAGIAAACAAVLLALGVGVLATRPAQGPVFVAVLLTDQNRPAAVVNAFANGHVELRPLDTLQVPPGRSLQVWTVPAGNRTPVPIGLLNQLRSVALDLARLPALRPDQAFAISIEPPGGSPTGQPTGPVILHGNAITAL
jgi:anti-sigma-K factor RskA